MDIAPDNLIDAIHLKNYYTSPGYQQIADVHDAHLLIKHPTSLIKT